MWARRLALIASLALYGIYRKKNYSFKGKHVVVVGGSSGIGKELVYSLLRRDVSRVSIVSRSLEKMRAVVDGADEIDRLRYYIYSDQFIFKQKYKSKIEVYSCDVSKKENVKTTMTSIIESKKVDCLVNCAGLAVPGYFLDQDSEVFESTMQLDYFGTLYACKEIVPHMIENGGGHIVFVSSTCGVIGVPGYTTYCPAKFAVCGLAQTMRSELAPYGITFSVVYPPDTDTPGYAQENLTKPEETKIISGGGKAVHPKVVADAVVTGVQSGDYHIAVDITTKMCVILSAGLTPFYFPFFDIILAPVCRLVGIIGMHQNDNEVLKVWKKKNRSH
ncbi:3-dehydrosphinganine reductase [Cavenderia fasciculata]|uniref:3-dehydrosphinganine reductase n=1 Tax=Cavenderia fasciculata TaxID=261658 RepID=F4Q321_CACFS|nr:3-dehydrosphinganine reductase [Cavenderia fasciculata]EGG17585.1 3-dehydrosphinganine reductase [Cavenderia fasciculata]|eukprot:XP_004356069.1 3-dehydrosphinganine reductase [Cavenderia fasciculata]